MHSERNVEIPRKENEEIPRLPAGSFVPICFLFNPFWAIMVFIDPHWPFLCSSALSYTFILEEPQVDMEVQLFFKASFHLSSERFFTLKNWKSTLRVCFSLPVSVFPSVGILFHDP